jgi:GTP cyclohydrolase I
MFTHRDRGQFVLSFHPCQIQKTGPLFMSNSLTDDLAGHYRAIIDGLGENCDREGLQNTPLRAAKAMQFLTRGYQQDLNDLVNNAVFESAMDEMVVIQDIELYSMCEHHVLPFIGKCHIAYLPQGKVLGLSKFARIVDMYARRLQIQENLTRQIAEAVESVTNAKGVAVVIEAQHMCMMMRGVEKQNSKMKTSMMLGQFRKSQATRLEFFNLIGTNR